MDKQFDDLSKSLAEGASRREALRKFSIGLAAALLAAVGLSRGATANPRVKCKSGTDCTNLGYIAPGCCKGYCTDLGRDTGNCLVCGNVCKKFEYCDPIGGCTPNA